MSTNNDGDVNEESEDKTNPSPSQQQHVTVKIGVELEPILDTQELQRRSLSSTLGSDLPTFHGRSTRQGWSFGSKHFPDLKVTLVTSKSKVGQI